MEEDVRRIEEWLKKKKEWRRYEIIWKGEVMRKKNKEKKEFKKVFCNK